LATEKLAYMLTSQCKRYRDVMTAEQEWADRIKRYLKGELKHAGVTYEELAQRMTQMGLEETKVSVASKLSRGGFGATFFLTAMKAINKDVVRLDDL
jgi:hypothetical protein